MSGWRSPDRWPRASGAPDAPSVRSSPDNGQRAPAESSGVQPSTEQPTRLTLTRREAALALGVSLDFLEDHVLRELRVVRRGRLRLIPVAELERWVHANATRTAR